MVIDHCSGLCKLEVNTAAVSGTGRLPYMVPVENQEPNYIGRWYETDRNSGDNKKH